jgi:hypothetical protein
LGETCGKYVEEEQCIESFGEETRKEETILNAYT